MLQMDSSVPVGFTDVEILSLVRQSLSVFDQTLELLRPLLNLASSTHVDDRNRFILIVVPILTTVPILIVEESLDILIEDSFEECDDLPRETRLGSSGTLPSVDASCH